MSFLNDAKKKLDELKNGKAGGLVAGNLDKVTAAANKATKGKYRGQIDSVGHKVEQYLENDRPSSDRPPSTPDTQSTKPESPDTTSTDTPDDGPAPSPSR